MDEFLARKLVELNKDFYARFAGPFAASRSSPQPGFARLPEYLPDSPLSVLDVGCGNGRFGRFLLEARLLRSYVGVDLTPALLAEIGDVEGELFVRDISLSGSLQGLGEFDLVACLATLQHIPGHSNRVRLLLEMAEHLKPAGYIVMSNWQFVTNPRQRRKIRAWSSVGIDQSQVEPNDYLMAWDRGGSGVRYVAHIDADLTRIMAEAIGLRVVQQFASDGREGDLNLYTILAG